MKRTLLTLVAAQATVGLALVPLWWRSPARSDWVILIRPNGDTVRLSTHPHGLTVHWSDAGRNPDWSPWPWGWLHAGWNRGSTAYGRVVLTRSTPPTPSGSVTVWSSAGTYVWQPTGPHWAGLGFSRRTVPVAVSSSTAGTAAVATATVNYHVRSADVPFWLLVPACLAPAAVRLSNLVRHRRRFAVGHCQRCGYDLRGSPGRCPECGAVPAAA